MSKITVNRKVLKQALEALDRNWDGCANSLEGEAIFALKAELAQPEQAEPSITHAETLLREALPYAEWQDKHIYPVRGKTYQNWLLQIYLPVPLSAKDKSPEKALERALKEKNT